MTMTSRERLLTVLDNGRPDRLPCQVHSWMPFYLKTYLNGMDQWQAYEHFDMDQVVYLLADWIFDEKDLANWQLKSTKSGIDQEGNESFVDEIKTPDGTLTLKWTRNRTRTVALLPT